MLQSRMRCEAIALLESPSLCRAASSLSESDEPLPRNMKFSGNFRETNAFWWELDALSPTPIQMVARGGNPHPEAEKREALLIQICTHVRIRDVGLKKISPLVGWWKR